MHHWWQLGIRNWRVRPGRTAGAIGAIALGVGVVVWVTCAYQSVRLALRDQVWLMIGKSHLSIESGFGAAGTVYESLAEKVAEVPNVKHVTRRLKHQMKLHPLKAEPGTTQPEELPSVEVQAIGIDPAHEYYFREYHAERVDPRGRLIQPGETDTALIERTLAEKLDLDIDDRFVLRTPPLISASKPAKHATFTIVGIIEHRRVAKRQWPAVIIPIEQAQELAQYEDDIPRVTKIDLILEDAAPKEIRRAEMRVRRIVDREKQGFLVTSAEAKVRQVRHAESQTGFVLAVLSSVALFTAFFIILSTLSMGMVERVGQLGLLRCLGTTRLQIAALVLGEAVPLGAVGMVLGIPVGLALAKLTTFLAPEYVGEVTIHPAGLMLAMVGGGITTLAGAALPMVQAMRVSPLAASRPQAKPPPATLLWISGAAGLGLVGATYYLLMHLKPTEWLKPVNAVGGVAMLYAGFALITPLIIRLVGPLAVALMALVLRVRYRLLSEQVGRAAWRSAAISCGLMVGLSLIVSIVVFSDSLAAGWDFPSELAEAFVVVKTPISYERAEDILERTDGIKNGCLINESIRVYVKGEGWFFYGASTFVAGDPDGFFDIARLEFVEGDPEEAIAKLKQGGYILVTPQFVRAQKLGYGDKVPIRLTSGIRPPHSFEIAGVVTSPALDIAANYFNASGMLVQASVFVVLGTYDDVEKIFGLPKRASMFLINFDLPARPPPPEMQGDNPPRVSDAAEFATLIETWRPAMPERQDELDRILAAREEVEQETARTLSYDDSPLLGVFRDALVEGLIAQWSDLSPEQRWSAFREELVMRLVTGYSGSSRVLHGSVRALKQQIDKDLRRATVLLASVPMVALIVAALGVANLMMANVTSRIRQIAMLRAVGATQWQITRLVIGEALVLGAMGSAIGVGLGLLASLGLIYVTEVVWGYRPELTISADWVTIGIAFTMSVCLIAGVLPARYAARSNVIQALQTT